MIRPVLKSDSSAIADIYNRYIIDSEVTFEIDPLSTDDMSQRIEAISMTCPYLVDVDDHSGIIRGYAYAHPWKERAAYSCTLESTVYVRHDYKHSGVGMRLMQALIKECRRMGYHSLIACITGSNIASIEFHQRLGFSQVSLFRQVGFKHGRYHDVVDLQLML